MQRVLALALAGAIASVLSSPASASLVFDSSIHLTAQGFGNAPRILTIQATGNKSTESGCVSVGAGGTISVGTCMTSLQVVYDPNGVANIGGNEPNPHADNQKYGIPTVASLGWNSAADIGLLFNATEPGGDGVVINDITLKFYDATGNFLTAIDGEHTFASTNPGNGVAGFVFVVDSAEQSYLNSTIFNQANFGTYRIALESTISSVAGGPETWLAYNRAAPPPSVPEPGTWAMMLLGFGAIGVALRRRGNGGLTQLS